MMKYNFFLLIVLNILMTSCSSNEDLYEDNTTVTINFNHYWGDSEIATTDYSNTEYTTENSDVVTINGLKYLISDIYIENDNSIITELSDYILVNPIDEQNLTFSSENLLPDGTYDLYFRLGFSDEDNIEDAYEDLNTEDFNLPDGFGDGYYYMQFDGEFYANASDTTSDSSTTTDFEYYMARAVDNAGTDSATFEDTSFTIHILDIEVIDHIATIEIKVDLAQWFTDPNLWNLTNWNSDLLSNAPAQREMTQNGDSVFSKIEE